MRARPGRDAPPRDRTLTADFLTLDPRAALLGLMPLPLAEVGPVLAAAGVARHVPQNALNDALRAGEVRLAGQDGTVLVVAGAVP